MNTSYTMTPLEYDAMLQSHFSKTQLLRQLSMHTSNTSGSKRGTARVRKQTSANNSPHHVQRRRTTANHTTRTSPLQTQEQRLRNYYNSRQQVPSTRPMSWHPGTETRYQQDQPLPTHEPAMVNTIADFENLAVSRNPDASVQQSVENTLAMGYGFPVTTSSTTFDQSPMNIGGHGMQEGLTLPTYEPYAPYDVMDQPQYPYNSQAPMFDTYVPMGYHMEQWSQTQPYPNFHVAPLPQPQEVMPIRAPAPVPQNFNANTRPRVARKGSKELVSIGLYDNKDKDFMSALNSAVSSDPGRNSIGKGLKLEETWQPPNDDEDEDEGEVYSSDEGDDIDEVPQVLPCSAAPEVQTSFYPPTYGDMSNQSFFFTDDDRYTSGSHYADYYAIDQYQDAQPKMADPATGNFLWV